MHDSLLILAEGASGHSEGVSPFLIGGAAFLILLCLLGITYLFSGLNQRNVAKSADVAHRGSGHGPSGHGDAARHGSSARH